jgi:uncharacterized membrane protein YdjX (TVP38/TMEM64 family)
VTESPPAQPRDEPLEASRPIRLIRWVVGSMLALCVVGFLVSDLRLPSRDELATLLAPFGAAAMPIFAIAYGLLAAVGFPVTVLIATAVWLFGFGLGFVAAMIGGVLGAAGGFWLARFLGRDWVRRRLADRRRLRRLVQQVEDYGAVVVFLLRALPSPLPFALINSLLGVTRIDFLRYLVATALGMVPSVAIYCYAASKLLSPLVAGQRAISEPGFWVAVALILLMTVGLPLIFGRLDRAAGGRFIERLAARLAGRAARG